MKRISEETAVKEYGIVKGHWTPNYYLTKDGFVIDSDDCLRYSPIPINSDEELQKIMKNIEKERN